MGFYFVLLVIAIAVQCVNKTFSTYEYTVINLLIILGFSIERLYDILIKHFGEVK